MAQPYERAIELNPNDADVLGNMADAVTAMGQPERAVGQLQRAIRLNPCHPDWYLWHLGDAQFNLGRYEEAIGTLTRMRDPTEAHRLLAATYALLGDSTQLGGTLPSCVGPTRASSWPTGGRCRPMSMRRRRSAISRGCALPDSSRLEPKPIRPAHAAASSTP